VKRYAIVGGLVAFIMIAIWLGGRDPSKPGFPVEPGWRRVHWGAIDAAPMEVCRAWAPTKKRLCLDVDTVFVGNLHFAFTDTAGTDKGRVVSITMFGLSGPAYYGARYHDLTDTLQVRPLMLEEIP